MNAKQKVVETKPAASLAELEASQADIEHRKMLAEQANAQARTDLAAAIASADSEAISDARARIGQSAADIAQIGGELAAIRPAVEEAKRRNHESFNQRRLQTLGRLANEMVQTSEALELATAAWAVTRKAAIDAAVEYESELSRCGATFDAFLSVATRMDARIELLLWLETDGSYGRARSLDTPTQLRESRRASLALAAQDFRTFTLRIARGALGFSQQEEI